MTSQFKSNPVYPSENAEFGEAAMTDVMYSKASPGPALLSKGGYVGDIDFCLQSTDTALSGSSRSKIINDITNQAFKALIIGFAPAIEDVLSRFTDFSYATENAICFDGGEENLPIVNVNAEEERKKDCAQDKIQAQDYLERLQKLLASGEVEESVMGGIYDHAYKRLLTLLRDAGCVGYAVNETPPRPVDVDICLSTMDRTFFRSQRSRTQELNELANTVSRAIVYGGIGEKRFLADWIERNLNTFACEWLDGNMDAQEIAFQRALVVMLREGALLAAQLVGYLPTDSTNAVSDTSEGGVSLEDTLADDLTATPRATADSAFVASSSPSTIGRTAERMKQVGDSSQIGGIISEAYNAVESPPLRLYDSYLIAFQRVVEACLIEINKRTEYIPQNEEVLVNFVNWERTVRKGLTNKNWKQNPGELIGTWKLQDVAGDGSLSKIMTAAAGMDQSAAEVPVELKAGGVVDVTLNDFEGQTWTFTPGPAHLDTLEFVLRSRSDSRGAPGAGAINAGKDSSDKFPDIILQYVGFIDRGQRVESRLSGSPIRMTGRVVSIVKGDWKVSNRFIMTLERERGKPGG